MANRHASNQDFQLENIDRRLEVLAKIELPEGHELRPRGVFYDDKNSGFSWYVDYLYEKPSLPILSTIEPVPKAEAIANYLSRLWYEDGQWDNFDITPREVWRVSDTYDPDHYSHYENVSDYI